MKTVLITGATSGIGKALAIACCQQGYSVLACGRNAAVLSELQQQYGITTLQFDVTDLQQTKAALQHVSWDIAVLNAGTCEYIDVDQFNTALFKRVFEPNFFGVIHCVEALLPSAQAGKQIIIIDSMARLFPFTRAAAYGASKAALYYFAKSLAVDLHEQGIIVKTISPGFVETPLTNKNDFAMPMKVSVDVATTQIIQAFSAKSLTVYFPRVFGWIMRALSLLPAKLQMTLSVATIKRNK